MLVGAGLETAEASGVAEAKSAVSRLRPRVVVCEEELPDASGAELIRFLHADPESGGTYCVLLGCGPGSQLAAVALAACADDYLSKTHLNEELSARVRVGIRTWSMHEALRRAAITDGLTGLITHDHFCRILSAEFDRCERYGHCVSLIVLDIDFFKAINDTCGHPLGDEVLTKVAGVLRECVRDVDTVGRLGGEEFAVILPESRAVDAVHVAERIRLALPASIALAAAPELEVTASLGIADSDGADVSSGADLIGLADRALYVAKRQGRNCIRLGDCLDDTAEVEADVEHDDVAWLHRRVAVLNSRLRDMHAQSIATLLKALDEKDPYAAQHSVNVAFYAGEIARELACSDAVCKSIYNAALLHDIGKVGVPDSILMKRSPLTPLEQMVIDQVPMIGTRIVDHMRVLDSEIPIIQHQREFFDGTGTPAGLAGEHIPIGARILMVADAFDAMTADRIYRARMPVEQVLAEIARLGGSQFDPQAGSALTHLFRRHRPRWEARIRETVIAARVPADERLAISVGTFPPSFS